MTEPRDQPFGHCATCGSQRPLDALTQAYSFDFRPIEGRLWCRDKDACYSAWCRGGAS